jgi:hypothetical protein
MHTGYLLYTLSEVTEVKFHQYEHHTQCAGTSLVCTPCTDTGSADGSTLLAVNPVLHSAFACSTFTLCLIVRDLTC